MSDLSPMFEMPVSFDKETSKETSNETIENIFLNACRDGMVQKVGEMLQETPDLVCFETADTKNTPLLWAIKSNQFEIVKILVEEFKANVNHNEFRENPLTYASFLGNLEIVKFLLYSGARVDLPNKDLGAIAFQCAAHQGHLEICKVLKEHGSDPEFQTLKDKSTALMWPSRKNKMNVVQYLVNDLKVNANQQDINGWTALMTASRRSCLEIVEYLVSTKKADVNIKDKKGSSALMYACRYGLIDVVKFLVEKAKADINTRDFYLCTLLMGASRFGHLEVVKYLVNERKVNVNETNRFNENAVFAAVLSYNSDVLDFLLKNGASRNFRRIQDKKNAFQFAVENKLLDMTQVFMRNFVTIGPIGPIGPALT